MINKAIDAICQLNADEKLREQIRVQQKAEYDYGNDIAVAEERGAEEGRNARKAEGGRQDSRRRQAGGKGRKAEAGAAQARPASSTQ